MNPKQKAFANYYIETGNAYQSAVKAGYSINYAKGNAIKLLENVSVKKYIEEQMKKLEDEQIAKADEVLKLLTRIIRDEESEEVVVMKNIGDFMNEPVKIDKKLDAKDRIKAAELIGKRYRLWTDKVEVEGAIPIVIAGDDELED